MYVAFRGAAGLDWTHHPREGHRVSVDGSANGTRAKTSSADGGPPPARPTPLVGRGRERALLVKVLDQVSGGVTRLVTVLGEPGMGKTRLLHELTALAADTGWTVLWGGATEFEHEVPFGVFAGALDDHLATIEPDRLAALDADSAALLPKAFRSMPVRASTAIAPDMMDVERYRLHRAVRDLLEVMAEPAGLVLVLDDVHWADEASVELLGHLLRHPPRGPLLLAIAYRPRQASAHLCRTLAPASQHGVAAVVELAALSRQEADDLMPTALNDVQRGQLYTASGGNPFYLQALGRAGIRPGRVEDAGTQHESGIPAAVRAALLAELATLTAGQLLAARAGAVAGGEFDVHLMAEIAEMTHDDALAAVDRLVAVDLVRADGVAGRLRYRHPLVRAIAYESAGAGWRLAAHGRAAAALRDQGASVVERAHHVERSASRGDLEAANLLTEAAAATTHTAPAPAARLAAAALRLLPNDVSSTPQRLVLLGLRARALGVTGRLHESREALHEVLQLIPPELAEERARTASFCATIEHLLGRHVEGRALLQYELSTIGEHDGGAAAILVLGLLSGQLLLGEFTAQQEWISVALQAARRNPDPALLALALGVCAVISYTTGELNAETVEWFNEAVTIIDALPDGGLARRIEAAVWVGMADIFLGHLDDAVRHLDRALRLSRSTGQNHMVSHMHVGRGSAHMLVGDLSTAGACFDDALEAAVLNDSAEMQSTALAYQSWVTALTGDTPSAVRLGKEAVALAGSETAWRAGMAHGMYAQALYFAGDPTSCVDVLTRGGGGPELPRMDHVSRPSWYYLLAAAESAAGRIEQAAQWADRAEATAAPLGLPLRTGCARLARAHALLPVQPAAALAAAEAAAESFELAGTRIEIGRCHLLAGQALGAIDEVDRARDRFAQARALFADCGAQLFLEVTVREERRMNARMPRRSRQSGARGTDPTGDPVRRHLTAREYDVAGQAAQGLSNRQIAEKLHLSTRTVELHLSRVFAKLGVSSRAAVAAQWAARPTTDREA
jgi:DNA-binding CsgD family transcriptional regulator